MDKREFLKKLRKRLSSLPREEREERIAFYAEMIDDRTEDGISEEEAIAQLGGVEGVLRELTAEGAFSREKSRKGKPGAGTVVLLILGAPLWLALLIVAFALLLVLYVVLWALDISLWAVGASVAVCGLAGVVGGFALIAGSGLLPAAVLFGAGLFCAGLSVFLFYGCAAATKGVIRLTGSLTGGLIHIFHKENK